MPGSRPPVTATDPGSAPGSAADRRGAADPRSRRAILELLKWHGPQDARTLAGRLEISAMAVRQHLYALALEKLVTSEPEPRPMGRPAKLWRLTPAADELFPNAHADLTVSLIHSLRETFGESGVDRLIAARTRSQIEAYRAQVGDRGSLRERLLALAKLRTREGYMAEVREEPGGVLLLIENHCPICTAAKACTNLCAGELRVFQEVLGAGVQIERIDHILAGARRCAYRVQARPTTPRRAPS
ncbi:MAG TPA: metalloregulator ArsR/SmtB family transcription factor [Thermoanaerobaculia bacterium]|jgi:predicted ArsR family transcriptional regulator|nr:metalloregulator ArsR/SmtB family transcription factor [Thermoanaerobaculia bacterium]